MSLNLPATFTYEKKGRIALMTINRPDAYNSFTREMLVGMDAAFDDFNADPNLWVAVITGAGNKAFCTGMDIKDALQKMRGKPSRPAPEKATGKEVIPMADGIDLVVNRARYDIPSPKALVDIALQVRKSFDPLKRDDEEE